MKRSALIQALTEVRDKTDRLIAELLDGESNAGPANGDEPARPPFIGFRLESRYAGKCHVCGGAYDVGDPVLYNKSLKRSAHPQCGQLEQSGGRR